MIALLLCRYTHFHGQHVRHPLDGRLIPIICDAELVDMNFGTGAVKITPAHDPNDFATGRRHNLESINILSDDGSINSVGGQFTGQPRFKVGVHMSFKASDSQVHLGHLQWKILHIARCHSAHEWPARVCETWCT